MRKISIALCAFALYMVTACTCATGQLNSNATYKWTYTASDGTTSSGEFTTNEYGQAMFEVPPNVECGSVSIEEKRSPQIAPVESAA